MQFCLYPSLIYYSYFHCKLHSVYRESTIYIENSYCRTLNCCTYWVGRRIIKTIICVIHLPFWLSSSCWVQFSSEHRQREKRNEECNYRQIQRFALETSFNTLTRVGVRVAVCFSPLVRRGLLIEVILRLHQRERVWEEWPTAHGLMVPQPTVTAAFLRPIRQVKRDAPLRL